MTNIEWQAPPTAHGSPAARHTNLRAELRARPGDWAVVKRDSAQSLAGNMRTRLSWQGFEITSRKQPDGRFTVYARFVGES